MDQLKSVNNLSESTLTPYQKTLTRAKVDLAIKNIFYATIILANVGAIGAVYFLVTQYCPIKAEPLIATSFIVGVIGGLISLKINTFGVNNYNLSQYVNPVTLLGRGLAYVFFGPAILIRSQMDRTDYGNPAIANKITGELKNPNLSFAFFADHYGSHIDNLVKYGFINKENHSEVKGLYEEYLPAKKDKKYYLFYAKKMIEGDKKMKLDTLSNKELLDILPKPETPNGDNELICGLRTALDTLVAFEDKWVKFKAKSESLLFPMPKLDNTPNFKKWHVRVFYDFRDRLSEQFKVKAA